MSPVLLDTNILSLYLRGDGDVVDAASRYLDEHGRLTFSQVSYYEILRGLLRRDARRQMEPFQALVAASVVVPLSVASLTHAAQLWASLTAAGRPIGDLDLLIAGTALAEGLALVTRNRRHFEGLPGLVLEAWGP